MCRVKESSGGGGNKGRYSGLALTKDGDLIAARTEKASCVLKVGCLLKCPKDQKVNNIITRLSVLRTGQSSRSLTVLATD